ncbi:serpin family protein [Actinocorallia lasiicapitis]
MTATAGCAGSTAQAKERKGVRQEIGTGNARELARSDLGFGLRLLESWCKEAPKRNIVFSPSSLAAGLGMVALGAKDKTAEEMSRVLGLPADPLASMRDRTLAIREIPGVQTSDRIWADDKVDTDQSFLDALMTGYEAGLQVLPIESDAKGAANAINKSVADDTKGLIKDLVSPKQLDDVGWVLTDTIHLKADWKSKFEPDSTETRKFTTAEGPQHDVKFVRGDSDLYGTATGDGWTSVTLPYAGDRLEAVALLPDQSDTDCPELRPRTVQRLTDEAADPTAAKNDDLTPQHQGNVAVTLPKLNLTTKKSMDGLLKALGMPTAFSQDADFSGISPNATRLEFVQHAAALKLDEKGTEAAAATAVGVRQVSGTVIRKEVTFDRPFVLLIRDTKTGEPLFLSRIADPAQH